jgi:uncharacterized protein YndB with AHSA1/START domain
MSVKKTASGRRSIEVEVEVPGTPEEVWQAIATGPGISSWFVPTEVEEREGGAVTFHLGPDMQSFGKVTTWQPPDRLVYEEADWSPNAPPLASEWIVEARSEGRCVVRVVTSLFTSSEDWDNQLESQEQGWPPFFAALRLFLTHFRGQRCSTIGLQRPAPTSEADAWKKLTLGLGLAEAQLGERRSAPAGDAPAFAGNIERSAQGPGKHELLLRLDQPAPGVAVLATGTWEKQVHVAFSLYLFGDRAAEVAAREEPLWQAWMAAQFPAPRERG